MIQPDDKVRHLLGSLTTGLLCGDFVDIMVSLLCNEDPANGPL